jgi:hypothetical protein
MKMKTKPLLALIAITSLTIQQGICGNCVTIAPPDICHNDPPYWNANQPVVTQCGNHYFNIGTYHLEGTVYLKHCAYDTDEGKMGAIDGDVPRTEIHTYSLGAGCRYTFKVDYRYHDDCAGRVPAGDPCPKPQG